MGEGETERKLYTDTVTETQKETGIDRGDRQTETGETDRQRQRRQTDGDRQTCRQRQGDMRGRESQRKIE